MDVNFVAFLFGAVFGVFVSYIFRVWWRFVRWLWSDDGSLTVDE